MQAMYFVNIHPLLSSLLHLFQFHALFIIIIINHFLTHEIQNGCGAIHYSAVNQPATISMKNIDPP